MKVRMLKDMIVYPDGVHELKCVVGEKYDLPAVVATSWLKQGFAEEDKVMDPPKETKQKPKPRKK